MKTRLAWLLCVVLAAWALKHHYSQASADDLRWILAPTALLVEAVTGVAFGMESGAGYFSRERMFLIEKSCAGVNFMIAAFAMLAFVMFRRVVSGVSGMVVFAVGLVTSFAAAVMVNAVRITIAMWLAANSVAFAGLTPARIHRLEGIVVYFGGLLLLYELATRIEHDTNNETFHRLAVPIGFYYAVALAVPIVNGAGGGPGFTEHALMVLAVPPMLVLTCGAFLLLLKQKMPRGTSSDPPRRSA